MSQFCSWSCLEAFKCLARLTPSVGCLRWGVPGRADYRACRSNPGMPQLCEWDIRRCSSCLARAWWSCFAGLHWRSRAQPHRRQSHRGISSPPRALSLLCQLFRMLLLKSKCSHVNWRAPRSWRFAREHLLSRFSLGWNLPSCPLSWLNLHSH